MKKWTILVLVPLLLCLCAGSMFAQNRFQFAFHFSPMIPQGEFSDFLDTIGLGGTLDFTYRLPRTAFSIGTSFGFYIYGIESWWEPVSPLFPVVSIASTPVVATWTHCSDTAPNPGLSPRAKRTAASTGTGWSLSPRRTSRSSRKCCRR